jgi:hypothetical protein
MLTFTVYAEKAEADASKEAFLFHCAQRRTRAKLYHTLLLTATKSRTHRFSDGVRMRNGAKGPDDGADLDDGTQNLFCIAKLMDPNLIVECHKWRDQRIRESRYYDYGRPQGETKLMLDAAGVPLARNTSKVYQFR